MRLAEVQPPKTAATLSSVISFLAFSAKVGQSDAPSSTIGSICLPSTPPAALISSLAMASESRTVTSLIAIVPDSEFRKPTLTVSPSVFTQLVPPLVPVELEPTLLPPQADRASVAATVMQAAPNSLDLRGSRA